MSAPYLYTPQNNTERAFRPSPYAPPGHYTPLLHPGYYPSHWNPVIPPHSIYDSDDDSDSKLTANGHTPVQSSSISTRGPPGPNNIYPRPDYWRHSYPNKPRSCPLKLLFSNPIHLDPLLRFKKTAHPIHHDLRFSPSMDPHLYIPIFQRAPTHHDLRSLATNPPLPKLRLWHRLLPWYISITSHHGGGITVRDVLEQLHIELCFPPQGHITLYDYWTCGLTSQDRELVDRSCRNRIWETTGGLGNMDHQAICRVDYLGEECVFVGLVSCLDGSFEIKTTNVYA